MKKQRLSPRSIARFLSRLTPRVRPYRWSLIAAGVVLVASTVIALAFPLIVRELLDAAFLEGVGSCSTSSPSAFWRCSRSRRC